jgi:hypothetical protein
MGQRRAGVRGYGWTTVRSALPVAVAIVILVAPVSVGTHAGLTLKAPYKGVTSASSGVLSYLGCGHPKSVPIAWSPTSGVITGAASGTAKTCGKSTGTVGAHDAGWAHLVIDLALPFRVTTSGSHSIGAGWTVSLATSINFTSGGCPAKNLNTHPPLYSSNQAYCLTEGFAEFVAFASVADLSNQSWSSYNGSYAIGYTAPYWQNFTVCYNFGTPTCTNTVGPGKGGYNYGGNDPGFSKFTFSGTTTFTLWCNATNMVKTDRFALVLSVEIAAGADALEYNLAGPWPASSAGALNMATLGNGAKLNSVVIT